MELTCRYSLFRLNSQNDIMIDFHIPALHCLLLLGSRSLYRSRREVSPVEQYTIDCEYVAYFEPKNIQKIKYNVFFLNF